MMGNASQTGVMDIYVWKNLNHVHFAMKTVTVLQATATSCIDSVRDFMDGVRLNWTGTKIVMKTQTANQVTVPGGCGASR
eukprot:11165331-Ditylum_brightwellii.AAC.1